MYIYIYIGKNLPAFSYLTKQNKKFVMNDNYRNRERERESEKSISRSATTTQNQQIYPSIPGWHQRRTTSPIIMCDFKYI